MTEGLRLIPDFSGYYISEAGEVWDLEGELVPWVDENGELCIGLNDHQGGYLGPVWKLMVWAFYKGSRLDLMPVYLDGNPRNVSLDNLEVWFLDQRLNEYRKIFWEQRGRMRVMDRNATRLIRCKETGEEFKSASAAARATGAKYQNILKVLKGELKSTHSLHFEWF